MPTSQSVAPARAAVNPLGMLDRLNSPDITVYQGRCVRVRDRNAACTNCVDACTTGAIAFEDGAIVVTPSKCIGCGTCATACPTCALEAHNPDDQTLLDRSIAAMRANGGRAVFACSTVLDRAFGHCDETKVCQVTCLGRIEESLLADLAAAGARDVRFVEGACAGCEHSSGCDVAHEIAESAESILSGWGVDMPLAFVSELPDEVLAEGVFGAPVEDRKVAGAAAAASAGASESGAVASDAGDTSSDEAAAGDQSDSAQTGGAQLEAARKERFTKVGKNGTLPQFVPTRRGRLLATLRQLGDIPQDPISSRLWGEVVIDPEECGSCRMCTIFCPTGALRTYKDPASATSGIEHVPGRCVACGTCEAICPKHAVTLLHEVYPSDLYDNHTERFEVKPPEVELGRPDTIVNKMRKVLSASKYVSQA
jgi:formate hydrogenlyase subunit 6/NADH:ubiquinone oxidoreductase subunit I